MTRSIFEVSELVPAVAGEPRMSAALLADRLGMANRQTMMRLIERNTASLLRFGQYLATVAKNPSEKGGRPSKDFLLNEGQAIYIASKSGTEMSDEVHIGLVLVFLAFRHGRLVPGGMGKVSQSPLHWTEAKQPSATVTAVDPNRLIINRAYLDTLSEAHQATAHKRAAVMREIAAMIEDGVPRGAAMIAASEKFGVPKNTLYNHLRLIRMVPEPDWPAALAPQWNNGALSRHADRAVGRMLVAGRASGRAA